MIGYSVCGNVLDLSVSGFVVYLSIHLIYINAVPNTFFTALTDPPVLLLSVSIGEKERPKTEVIRLLFVVSLKDTGVLILKSIQYL